MSAAMLLCSGLSQTSSRCAEISAGSYCDSHPRRRSRRRRSSGSSSPPTGAGNQASRPSSSLLAIFTDPGLFAVRVDYGVRTRDARHGLQEKNRNTAGRILQAVAVSRAHCLLRPRVTSAGCNTCMKTTILCFLF